MARQTHRAVVGDEEKSERERRKKERENSRLRTDGIGGYQTENRTLTRLMTARTIAAAAVAVEVATAAAVSAVYSTQGSIGSCCSCCWENSSRDPAVFRISPTSCQTALCTHTLVTDKCACASSACSRAPHFSQKLFPSDEFMREVRRGAPVVSPVPGPLSSPFSR